MASLPTVNDREVLSSLKNQETLLENIARAVSKKENTLSKRSDRIEGDKRVIDEQQDKSMIRKILESFTRMGSGKTNTHDIQMKTFEETKLTKNIVQQTGLDIEFIRKSFEEGQKRKDRELLADALRGAIGGGSGSGGLVGTLAAVGGGLLGGLKVITSTISSAFSSILRVFSVTGLKTIFRGALGLAGAAAAAVMAGAPSETQTDTYEEDETLKQLQASGPGSEVFDRNVSEAAREKYYSDWLEKNPDIKGFADQLSPEARKRHSEEFVRKLFEDAKMEPELFGEAVTEFYDVYDEMLVKFREEHAKEVEKRKKQIESNTDSITGLDGIMKEGEKALDKVTEELEKLGGMVSSSKILDKLKNALLDLGTLKFENPYSGEIEELNLLDATGGALKGLYDMAAEQLNTEKEEPSSSNSVNTQVNNTNVINGGSSPVPFPNASASNDSPSLMRYLTNQGTLRY